MLSHKEIPEIIKKMPKVEIHLHLEGAFTLEFLFSQVQKYGSDRGINTVEDLQEKFIFKDFSHFIQTWFWKNNFFRKPEDFEESTFQTIKNLSQQNVVYAEAFFSPWDFASNGLRAEEIAEATISGIQKAEKEFPIKCGLIADIVRDHGAATSLHRLDQITPFLDNGIIGIGLGGNEKDFPPVLFNDVFLEANKRGFRTTAHAGEAAGSDSIWSAILDLEVERIGHGVRAIEDSRLMDYLLEKQIPLEVCITSNLKTRIFPSIEKHPFDEFYKKGLLVTVNSDDPTMFGTNITDELTKLHEELNYSVNDLLALTNNAVIASFLSERDKKKYLDTIEDFRNKVI